jgi:hypothetical protein
MVVKQSIKKYEKTFSRVTSRLSSIEGVYGCEQFGSIDAPGISDLDIWVFFTSSFQLKDAQQIIKQESKKTSIDLDIKYIPLEHKEEMDFILPNKGLGLDIDLIDDNDEKTRHLAFAFLCLWLPSKLRELYLLTKKPIASPASLRLLQSIKHSLKQFFILSAVSKNELIHFEKIIDTTRKSFLDGVDVTENIAHISACLYTKINHYILQIDSPVSLKNSNEKVTVFFDWFNVVNFGEKQVGCEPIFKSSILLKVFPPLYPIRVKLPISWCIPYNYWLNSQWINEARVVMLGNFPHHDKSTWISEQADIFGNIYKRQSDAGISNGFIGRPLIKKEKPRLLSIARLIFQRIVHH